MVFLERFIDKRVQNLLFMESPVIPLIYIAAYFTFLYFGKKFMKTRKPYDLKVITGIYNVAQVALCIINLSLIYSGGFKFDYLYKCYETDYSHSKTAMNMMHGIYFTLGLKALEFIETVFFVLRKKDNQITFLHVYHHVSTFVIVWFFTRSIAGGTFVFPFVINLWIHIFMYSYYFLSIFPSIQSRLGWFKKFITIIQLVQFLSFCMNAIFAIGHMLTSNCNLSKYCLSVYIFNSLFYLYLFGSFYRKSYVEKKKV